jgi:hypothetical protein
MNEKLNDHDVLVVKEFDFPEKKETVCIIADI